MAEAKEHLVVFEGVSAKVAGTDISSIIEMSLIASANAIPQLTLMVDAGNPGTASQGYVDFVSLANARSLIDKFRSLVKTDGATLELSVTCRDVGPSGGGSETLSISGWLLTDVSLSPVQRQGVCAVSLTFQHPICKSHLGGAVPGLVGAMPDLSEVDGDNPLEVFISALGAYSKVYRMEPVPADGVPGTTSVELVRDALIRHLDKAISALSSSVTWKGGGLPAQAQLGAWSDLIVKGLSSYALPAGGTSVFQTLSSRLIPECSLALGGDYTSGTLELGPFDPWASATLKVSEQDIISLQFPSNDPSPISGVKISMLATESEGFVTYQPMSAQLEDSGKPAEAFYVPEEELNADYLYGPIYMFQEPSWLVQTSSYEKSQDAAQVSDVSEEGDGQLGVAVSIPPGEGVTWTPGGGGGGGGIPAVDYCEAVIACAKAYYETSLMKDWSFTVSTRLMLSAGGTICPGKVLSVESDKGEAITGYVVAVEHTISVSARAAHTRIVCTHPRFGQLPKGIKGPGNALYT